MLFYLQYYYNIFCLKNQPFFYNFIIFFAAYAGVLNPDGLRGGGNKPEDVFGGVFVDVVGVGEGKKVKQFGGNGVVVKHSNNSFIIIFCLVCFYTYIIYTFVIKINRYF